MATRYIRRFRMEFHFGSCGLPSPRLPEGYSWTAWHPAHLERHARVKYDCFTGEIDARVFPCLSSWPGCRRLMSDMVRQEHFLPAATWLITWQPLPDLPPVDCATIQGLVHSVNHGSVQNVGVSAAHRGCGLGRALVLKSLQGFRSTRLRRVYLEVTATNQRAVALYRGLGFRVIRTMFKEIEFDEPQPSPAPLAPARPEHALSLA